MPQIYTLLSNQKQRLHTTALRWFVKDVQEPMPWIYTCSSKQPERNSSTTYYNPVQEPMPQVYTSEQPKTTTIYHSSSMVCKGCPGTNAMDIYMYFQATRKELEHYILQPCPGTNATDKISNKSESSLC